MVQRCAHAFRRDVQRRGAEYAEMGLVDVDMRWPHIHAEVFGSRAEPYEVDLGWRDEARVLETYCTCPYFWEKGPCKHLWAALHVADESYGDAVPGAGRITVTEAKSKPDSAGSGNGRPPPIWQQQLSRVRLELGADPEVTGLYTPVPAVEDLYFEVDLVQSQNQPQLAIELRKMRTKKDGSWTKPQRFAVSASRLSDIANVPVRTALATLLGAQPRYDSYYRGPQYIETATVWITDATRFPATLDPLSRSGRLFVHKNKQPIFLSWNPKPWKLELSFSDTGRGWRMNGDLVRGEVTIPIGKPMAVLPCGLVFMDKEVSPLPEQHAVWVRALTEQPLIPKSDAAELIDALYDMPGLPTVRWPKELDWERKTSLPLPRLTITTAPHFRSPKLQCLLRFAYGDSLVTDGDTRAGVVDADNERIVLRDLEHEQFRRNEILAAGVRERGEDLELSPSSLTKVVAELVATGWHIQADGVRYRASTSIEGRVSSNVDWFDLTAEIAFGEKSVSLPRLLKALRTGSRFVTLDDGSKGMLPDEWLRRYRTLARVAETTDDTVRFRPEQVPLVDALLAEHADSIAAGKELAALRKRLAASEAPKAKTAPATFEGELRPYQQEGLGWLDGLSALGVGGCLADDMGLGKTVQVLAFLDSRRRQAKAPTLIVLPRSLIFNWQVEAERFAPKLAVAEYFGADRDLAHCAKADVILTTYGVLRRDIEQLANFELDYVILDEAQAIKNATSITAKSALALRPRYRLALTGTPVENRLSELGSIMAFLNPGLFGDGSAVRELFKTEEQLDVVARAVRPFILRRTKQNVLQDLPPKTEQTLVCEMGTRQAELYGELRIHYRQALLKRVRGDGIKKAKMHVLEALLRLRQTACHPGLVSNEHEEAGSAKLELLFDKLDELLAEGHKALVFSQFTSLLKRVRARLDTREVNYAYLDGRTRKREEKVAEFQNNPDCKLFLISLKAGGYGLNLTSASYVFILDPWWNPAVESQAIDRTHRIGQQQPVHAYRLVTRNTVEEKIVELQNRKRRIAEAIVSENNSVLAKLTQEELELLLS